VFGAGAGGGAALSTAIHLPDQVAAVVSRGGGPELAITALRHVCAPTLLIVGGDDVPVIGMNRKAMVDMSPDREVRLEIVPGASHLFEEPGTLEEVARLTSAWFVRHLRAGA
jgi:putative phosphoribosyl transferase